MASKLSWFIWIHNDLTALKGILISLISKGISIPPSFLNCFLQLVLVITCYHSSAVSLLFTVSFFTIAINRVQVHFITPHQLIYKLYITDLYLVSFNVDDFFLWMFFLVDKIILERGRKWKELEEIRRIKAYYETTDK